jgi:PAS domain S-box-containing protein
MTADEHRPRAASPPQRGADELRHRAEALVDNLSGDAPAPISAEDVAALLHELAVHQIELEMQNEELRAAQLGLDEQREKYYDLFDLAPVGYLTLSDTGIVVDANLTAIHLLGVERQVLIGAPFSVFVYAEDRDELYKHLRAISGSGEANDCELRLQRIVTGAGGEVGHFWAHLESRLRQDAGIDSGQTWVTFTDIEELVEERDALQQSEVRFAALFEQAPLGYQSLDEDGRFLVVNEMWLETLGYTREEVIGRWFGDFLAPEFVDGFRERFPKFKARGVIHSEFEMMHKDGSRRTIAFEGRIGHNPDGSFQRTHCILADITESTKAAVALAESEDKYRFLFERSSVAQSMTTVEGVLSVNPAFCQMLGYTQEELADGPTWMALTHPDDIAENRRLFEGVLSGEQDTARFEKRYLHKDGSIVWVDVSTSLRRSAAGEPMYFMTTILDITERKQAESNLRVRTEELERSNDELQRFAYVASHDLREPLRMVTSYTQLLKKRYAGQLDSDADDFIGYAVDGAARMEALIQDLLAYSRVGSQGHVFHETDLGPVLDGVLKGLEVAIDEAGATVTFDEMPTVVCDGSQVGQVFQNLISNAVKFRRDELMRIHVGAERVGGEWVFSVRDNGLGIDAEYFDRIFVIFQRLQVRDSYEGSGMGLAICKRIVERHHGRIRVESTPGEGSTFYFTIPA